MDADAGAGRLKDTWEYLETQGDQKSKSRDQTLAARREGGISVTKQTGDG